MCASPVSWGYNCTWREMLLTTILKNRPLLRTPEKMRRKRASRCTDGCRSHLSAAVMVHPNNVVIKDASWDPKWVHWCWKSTSAGKFLPVLPCSPEQPSTTPWTSLWAVLKPCLSGLQVTYRFQREVMALRDHLCIQFNVHLTSG